MSHRRSKYADQPDVSPRTREILTNEERYGSGPPHWRAGKHQRPAQTSEEARDERLTLIKRLRKHASEHPGAEAVAERLDSCEPDSRCHSGACPECNRAYTRWFVTTGSALLRGLSGSTSVLSLVHADLSVPVRKLTPEHLRKARKKTHALLIKSGITTFIGGIDISANEDETGETDPYFQPQSWVLAPTKQVTSAEQQLRKTFPRTKTTPRPAKIQEWDGDLAALGYALKNTFDRRVAIVVDDPAGRRNSHRNTRDRNFRVEQHIELLIALDQAGLHARLHLGGCRVVHTHSGPEIRLITSE